MAPARQTQAPLIHFTRVSGDPNDNPPGVPPGGLSLFHTISITIAATNSHQKWND